MSAKPKPNPDPIMALLAEINGSCKTHIVSGINGNISAEWRAYGLTAHQTYRSPQIAVFVEAERRTMRDVVGAKLEIDPPYDHLKLADGLAAQLNIRIRSRVRPLQSGIRVSLAPGATMPTRGTDGSSGYDLYSISDVVIRVGQVVVIHSGVTIELLDETWEAQIRPRSGMSKRGLWVSLGTVDSDYRGVIGATVANVSREDQKVSRGERYAQMVLGRVEHPGFALVDTSEMSETPRGAGGFGSTGK